MFCQVQMQSARTLGLAEFSWLVSKRRGDAELRGAVASCPLVHADPMALVQPLLSLVVEDPISHAAVFCLELLDAVPLDAASNVGGCCDTDSFRVFHNG